MTRERIRNGVLVFVAGAAGVILTVLSKPPAVTPPGTCTSISQYGITWNFNKAVPCAQFVTGDWAVAPAAGDSTVTFTSKSPAFDGSSNGFEVNPTTATAQGYDSRIQTGGVGFNAALVPTLPLAVSPDSSVVGAISTPGACAGANNNFPCLDTVTVVTVLASIPANISLTFRPGWAGTSKRLFTTNQLQTGALPSLAPVTGTPSLATMEARMQRPQFDPMTNFLGRFAHPFTAFYDYTSPTNDDAYGAEAAKDWSDAILRLFLNDSLAAKQTLLNEVVQAGIDQYVFRKNFNWGADGGHYVGRKILVAFAGLVLADSDMQTVAGDTSWDENQHITFSTAAGVSGRKYFSDTTQVGMPLFGKTCSAGAYLNNQQNAPSGTRDCKDDLGPSSTQIIDGGENPADTYNWCCTQGNYRSESLIQRLMAGLPAVFNFNPLNEFVDRMQTFGTWTLPVSTGATPRPNDWSAQNGVTGGITNGSSVFDTNMWNTYKPSTTFCGVGGCAGDVTPPTVSVTAPTNGAQLSGTFNVTAIASDDVAVAGVQFKLDGSNLGSEDTSAPYSTSWNTTSAANGSHSITAVARDTSSNSTTSSAITFSVLNGSGVTTGASLATCSGGTCTPGTGPSGSGPTHVANLNGNPTWEFGWYVPNGLQGTAPVVMAAGGGSNCGSIPNTNYSGWSPTADAHKYIAISLVCPLSNGSPSAQRWGHEEGDAPPSAGTDTQYTAAVANYLATHVLNGVTPDMSRLYFYGGSSGGHQSWATLCSSNTVSLFRAVTILSAAGTTTDDTNAGCLYQNDKSIFAQYIGGTAPADPYLPIAGKSLGFAKTNVFLAGYFGCNATPTSSQTTVNGISVTTSNYTGCPFAANGVLGNKVQFQSVFVNCSAHSAGIDSPTSTCIKQSGWLAGKAATFFDGTTN